MKIKTNELIDKALNWAVGSVEKLPSDMLAWQDGESVIIRTVVGSTYTFRCEFSTQWAQGGPIIEREKITVSYDEDYHEWNAGWGCINRSSGPTLLIAAMRAYVTSKLGDEVDIPEELV